MQLKQYQADTLAVLRRFLEEARMVGPKNAYETITTEPDYADRLGRYGGRYGAPLTDLPTVPYVCLRLPTGGGNTILGAHAVAVARDAWVEKDYPLVMDGYSLSNIKGRISRTERIPRRSERLASCGSARATARACSALSRKASTARICAGS